MSTGIIDIAGRETESVTLPPEVLNELRSRVEGPLLRPGDPGWDAALVMWNGMVAKAPALVLQPVSAHDVAEAVAFARDRACCSASRAGVTTSPERPSPSAA